MKANTCFDKKLCSLAEFIKSLAFLASDSLAIVLQMNMACDKLYAY